MDEKTTLFDHYVKLEKDLVKYPPQKQKKIIDSMTDYFAVKNFRCPSSLLNVFLISNAIGVFQFTEVESASRLYGVTLTCVDIDLIRTIKRYSYV